MNPRVIEGPAAEPVTLADVKTDLRIDHNDHDAFLTQLIVEARQWVERRAQLSFITQTLEYIAPRLSSLGFTLPNGPVQSVVAFTYDDSDGTHAFVEGTDYTVVLASGLVKPVAGWPAADNFTVQYVAGFGDTADDVEGPLKQAIRLRVQELYDATDTAAAIDRTLTNYLTMVA